MDIEKAKPAAKVGMGPSLAKVFTAVGLCVGLAFFVWLLDRASISVQLFTYGFTPGFYLNGRIQF